MYSCLCNGVALRCDLQLLTSLVCAGKQHADKVCIDGSSLQWRTLLVVFVQVEADVLSDCVTQCCVVLDIRLCMWIVVMPVVGLVTQAELRLEGVPAFEGSSSLVVRAAQHQLAATVCQAHEW